LTYRKEPDFRVIYSKKELTLKNSSQKVYRSYLFGFNSMPKDNEIYGPEGSGYDFGARIYDSRLGRWMAIDPLYKDYPNLSSFIFSANSPIVFKDIDGRKCV